MEPHLVFTPAPDSSSTCDAQSEGGGEAQGECHPGVKPPVSLVWPLSPVSYTHLTLPTICSV
eukprot:2997853-Rhodomonas_salina.1